MFEAREYLALIAEALAKPVEIAPIGRDFQRYSLEILRIVTAGFEHNAHAAAADFTHDTVRTENSSGPIRSTGGPDGDLFHDGGNAFSAGAGMAEQIAQFAA